MYRYLLDVFNDIFKNRKKEYAIYQEMCKLKFVDIL